MASFQETGFTTLQKRAERKGRAVCIRVGARRGRHGEQHAVHAEGSLQLGGHARLARGIAAQELRRAIALRPGPCQLWGRPEAKPPPQHALLQPGLAHEQAPRSDPPCQPQRTR